MPGSPGTFEHVEWGGSCGTNGMSVHTFTGSGANVVTVANQPFLVVVP